jgi:hypothetical protein
MHKQASLKTFLPVLLALFILSCNSTKEDKAVKEQTADTTLLKTAETVENTNNVSLETTGQKCFSNDGLKYTIAITINFTAGTQVTGKIISTEMGTDKRQAAKFTGTVMDDQVTVQFAGTPPVVGDASTWTSKPWKLDNRPGKEKLSIVFNAKNFETNKWEEMEYEFAAVACQ